MKRVWIFTLSVSVLFAALSSFAAAETITIVAEDAFYPYCGEMNGTAQGISVDIVSSAFETAGVDVTYTIMPYIRGLERVKNGKHLAVFNTVRDDENRDDYFWPDEELLTARDLYYARDDFRGQITSVEDLEEKKLGLTEAYQYGEAIDNNNSLLKVWSRSDDVNVRKLVAGRVDVIILTEWTAPVLINTLNVRGKIKPVGTVAENRLFLAFSREHQDGRRYYELFQQGMAEIQQNGTYDRILQKWKTTLEAGE